MFSSAFALLSVCGLALGAVIPAPTLVRVPSQDSAVVQHHRLGGNFAYSAHEAHAYGVQTPIVEQRVVPAGVTFHQGVPQVRTHTTVHKQFVPQYGVVRTQHTVPTGIQYITGSSPSLVLANQHLVGTQFGLPNQVQFVAASAPAKAEDSAVTSA